MAHDFVEADRGHHFAFGGTPGFHPPPGLSPMHASAGPHFAAAHLPAPPHLMPTQGMGMRPPHPGGLDTGGSVHPGVPLRGLPSVTDENAVLAHRQVAGFAGGGEPMGMAPSNASPWWERSDARGEEQHPGGFVGGATAGRADHIPTSVASDSHIIPSDVISGLGEGNSLAGAAVMDRMLHSMPYGIVAPRMSGRSTAPHPPAAPQYAAGGAPEEGSKPVPVKLSSGEYNIPPEAVLHIGSGDMERGHQILDRFILHMRKKIIAEMKRLPPPKVSD